MFDEVTVCVKDADKSQARPASWRYGIRILRCVYDVYLVVQDVNIERCEPLGNVWIDKRTSQVRRCKFCIEDINFVRFEVRGEDERGDVALLDCQTGIDCAGGGVINNYLSICQARFQAEMVPSKEPKRKVAAPPCFRTKPRSKS